MSILNYFPRTKKPRAVQSDTLLKVQEYWPSVQLMVLNLPVAAGKSAVALSIAKWAHKEHGLRSAILTPTNILVEQYLKDYPELHRLDRQDNYTCKIYEDQTQKKDCKEAKRLSDTGKLCKGCPWMKDFIKAKKWAWCSVYNHYTYLFVKPEVDVLIIDEAHGIIDLVRALSAKTLWQHKLHYPANIRSYGDLYRWCTGQLEKPSLLPKAHKDILQLKTELENNRTKYLIQRTEDLYFGEPHDCIKLLPIDVRNSPPYLWPVNKIKKIILMSATINRKDIEQLGLDKMQTLFLTGESAIPAANRPFSLSEKLHRLSYRSIEGNAPLLAESIKEILAANRERGFIHTTYRMSELLRPFLQAEPRLMWHGKENKMAQYKAFCSSPPAEGKVLIASGLYEGVDLPEDLGRWQCITKVPWANLLEPAIAHQAEADPEWYANEAIKIICQAYGRICRTPTDRGLTIMMDESFIRLYNEWSYLFPAWFKDVYNGGQ